MSDSDLISFFQRAQKSLRPSPTGVRQHDGLIVVKENVCHDFAGKPATVFDDEDSSVTR